jgi:AraC-like DNA-binding protein
MGSSTVLSALVKGVLDAAAEVGLDPAALAREAGIDAAALDDPDGRVPLEHDLALWAVLCRQPVGLDLGSRIGLAGLGVVGYAMQHGATVGEALAWLGRFRAVIHPEAIARVERRAEGGTVRVVFVHVVPAPFLALREAVDAYASSLVAVLRGLTGRPVRPSYVAFPLPRPADPARHERYFSCPVAWGAGAVEVAFDATLLDTPLPRRDSRLFGYLSRRVEELQATLVSDASWTARARSEVGDLLARGEPRLGAVAQRLAVSERTLHRRLREEGTTFSALLEEARRARALILLEERTLSCSEIAFLLGYAEPAVFFRAFRRWTGQTPQRFRGGLTSRPSWENRRSSPFPAPGAQGRTPGRKSPPGRSGVERGTSG